VPATAPVEELPAAQPQARDEMLEVGHRRRGAAEHGGVEWASPGGEQPERDEAAADLEAPVGNVLVRHVVTGNVQRRAEEERKRARANEGTGGTAHRDMQRNDHKAMIAYAAGHGAF
jgi:hypothetical protein